MSAQDKQKLQQKIQGSYDIILQAEKLVNEFSTKQIKRSFEDLRKIVSGGTNKTEVDSMKNEQVKRCFIGLIQLIVNQKVKIDH